LVVTWLCRYIAHTDTDAYTDTYTDTYTHTHTHTHIHIHIHIHIAQRRYAYVDNNALMADHRATVSDIWPLIKLEIQRSDERQKHVEKNMTKRRREQNRSSSDSSSGSEIRNGRLRITHPPQSPQNLHSTTLQSCPPCSSWTFCRRPPSSPRQSSSGAQ